MMGMTKMHKRFLIFMTALCCLISTRSTTAGAPAQELFARANDCYKTDDFAKAYDLYLKIPEKSASAYYNAGNCAYKLKRYGQALLNWRRAEHEWGVLSGNREELLKNIEMVKKIAHSQTTGVSTEQGAPFASLISHVTVISTWFISIIRSAALLYLQLIVLVLWIMLFFYLRPLVRRRYKFVTTLLFVLLALTASMLAIKYSLLYRKHLVIIRTPAPLTSGPGTNFATLSHLPEAQEAAILTESGDFYKIRVNKQIGWINKATAEQI